jgi:hypothetical protein
MLNIYVVQTTLSFKYVYKTRLEKRKPQFELLLASWNNTAKKSAVGKRRREKKQPYQTEGHREPSRALWTT